MADSTKPTKPTMQQSITELTDSLRSLAIKIAPHFGFIYFTLMLLGITAAFYIVSQTMSSTSIGEGTVTNQKLSEYAIPSDQTTITKIKSLSDNSSSPSVSLPSGRINPFSESVY